MHEEQDIRKMGGIYIFTPITHAMMVIGTISLMGFPFTSGFYSKDAIIEAAYLSDALFFELCLFPWNFGCSNDIILFLEINVSNIQWKTRMEEQKFREVHESPNVMLMPLFILAIGALSFGYIFKSYFIGSSSVEFWNYAIAGHHYESHIYHF